MIVLCIVFSCQEVPVNKYITSFDLPLVRQNDSLKYSGDYEALIKLNAEYFKKADSLRYTEGKAECYLNVAYINITEGNYKKAQVLLNKADKILKHSNSNFHKGKLYNDYSQYYSHLKLYSKAIDCTDKGLFYGNKIENPELKKWLLEKIYISRGVAFAWKGWLGSSLKSFRKALNMNNSAYTNSMLAQYYLFTHKMDSAAIYVSRVAEKAKNEKMYDVESLWAYYTIGYYYNEINDYDAAEKNLNKALEFNIKTKLIYSSHIREVYQALSQLYKKKNDKEKAYFYLSKYNQEEDRLNNARLETLNKATEDFISESKKDSDWHKSDLPLLIALSIAAVTIFGIYIRRIIKLLSSKKKTLKKETDELKNQIHAKMSQEVMELAQKNDSSFLLKFKELYPDFITALLKINPELENSELAFCAMLKLHFSSKEIASYTFVQHKSIQQKKYRIRKRLNIPVEEDIYDFFDRLNN